MTTSRTDTRSSAEQAASDRSTATARGRTERYVPGLDGIRAIAVVAVMLFHFGVGGLAGGLLGVDVFFVLSGYLITTLLLKEWFDTGRIKFAAFYARRAKRLLPALFLMIVLVCVYAAWLAEPDIRPTIRGDVLSTIGYFSNWHFVFAQRSYFQQYGPPSPVLHTWSLAVEEQFYLVWPALAWAVLRRYGRKGLAVTATVGVAGSFAATFAMAVSGVDTSRMYYGTDVRLQELMAGALLALAGPAISRWEVRRAPAAVRPAGVFGAAGILGLVALLWMFHSVSGTGPFLYEGGFLLVAISTIGLIALTVHHPGHPLARLLATGPARYVGLISYGLYLYHYPIFVMIDGRRVGLTGYGLLAVRLAATFAVAVASFHLVERPIRNGRLRGRPFPSRSLLFAAPVGATAAATGIVLATVLPSSSLSSTPTTASAATRANLSALPATPPAGLTGVHQVRVMLVGDSMALTLGVGLTQDAGAWGAQIINRGAIGCDLVWNQTVNFQNQTGHAATGCENWPTIFPALIENYQPDVVAVLLGRFEYQNRLINGHWYTVGQAPWDQMITAQMEQFIRVLSADGAHVAMLTLPYVTQTTDAPNGQPWDVNQPSRTRAWNADVRRAAAAFPGIASVVDLNRMVDPGDRYTSYIDGIRVRDVDNEHFSPAGGLFLRPYLLPPLVALGRERALTRTS
jgi:peptidoglycan/LPS O-acetylase OafA/YrhL